ncbi:CopG family antitoxin [Fibrobacter sp. UWEL]|uniref:CopG family antitoxin n=1 Tax=Fibrobacter sp. UWEL TaxID=1896209 RepID=UPI00091C1CE9|nr:CopG family antitoxin [Fibrobacter sp. UWEL]SHL13290.1 CopG antitoxin of type II toxin-antitoxin system [Fibrobacter sp. UWEL]
MNKNSDYDIEYYQKMDFGDEMERADKEGRLYVSHGETVEEFFKKARARRQAEELRKMYSLRLKVRVVEKIKAKAAAAGVPYQTYINALLEKEVAEAV